MRVGFIGVGNIGLPMAEQIMGAGYPLVVNDLRPRRRGRSWRPGRSGQPRRARWPGCATWSAPAFPGRLRWNRPPSARVGWSADFSRDRSTSTTRLTRLSWSSGYTRRS